MNAWDETWKSHRGRENWLEPEPYVVSLTGDFREKQISNVLDLGYGIGRHAIYLAQEGFTVFGADISPSGAKYASQWSRKKNFSIHLALGEMAHLPFRHNSFDLVLAWNVIYHGLFKQIKRSVSEIERCLRPNGYLLSTLISTRHQKYGMGTELEKNTFILKTDQEKSVPHHYFDESEVIKLFGHFNLLACEDVSQETSDSYHWRIFARLK